MVAQIVMISKEFIKPSCPTPHSLKDHKFSSLDKIIGTNYVPLIFFYQNQPSSQIDHTQRSHQLKQSLSDVLTRFYPFAGRIDGYASVNCNDSGALFVDAQVHVRLSEAVQNCPIEELNQYLPLDPYIVVNNDKSTHDVPLAVQVSLFECGGIAIGACISHMVADACSFATFMKAWAATCRGEAEIVQPNFELGRLHFPPIPDVPSSTLERNADNIVASSTSEEREENFVTKRFVFHKEKLAELKEQASSPGGSSQVQNPTRVEVLSAFIWKHIMAVASDTKKMFATRHAINLRPRMDPPLSDCAIGNFSVPSAMVFVHEKDNDYDYLVGKIGQSVRKIKNVQKAVDYLNTMSQDRILLMKPEIGVFIFSSWCKFPLHVDYGWGKPLSICTAPFALRGVILMSTPCGEGIEAWISLEEKEMAMLPRDFLSLANNDLSK